MNTMKCNFCKKNENEINEIFAPIIEGLEKKISEISLQIQNNKREYPLKHGFTKENFEKVKKINENILEIKIKSFIANLKPFLKLEPNLNLLIFYLTKHEPKISPEETLKDLMNLYIKEPIELRLNNEVKELEIKQKELINYVKQIKTKNVFYEIKNEFEIPLGVFGFDERLMIYIHDQIKELSINNNEKILLCPYCSHLFRNDSVNIFNAIKKAKQKKKNVKIIKKDNHDSLKDWDFD
jgi:hypothetical protein